MICRVVVRKILPLSALAVQPPEKRHCIEALGTIKFTVRFHNNEISPGIFYGFYTMDIQNMRVIHTMPYGVYYSLQLYCGPSMCYSFTVVLSWAYITGHGKTRTILLCRVSAATFINHTIKVLICIYRTQGDSF